MQFPPGLYLNGTDYAAKGRYRRGNQVRFFKGLPQPVGGWTKIPFEVDNSLPQYVEFDGDDAYEDTFTTSGNLLTTVMRFNIEAFTGGGFNSLLYVEGPGNDYRVHIFIYASDEANTDNRNKIVVEVNSSSSATLCSLYSSTGYADGEDHILFFSFDADNGEATFVIDGANADDANNAARSAPTAGTLDSGASTEIYVAAFSNTPDFPITGNIGYFGYRDAYLTNWADFMDGNLPLDIDESGWSEWKAQPAYWAENGALTTNAGSAGNMTAVGDPTLVDSGESVEDFLPGYTRSIVSWRDSDGQKWLAIGTTRGLFAWNGSTMYDITPTGIGYGEQGGVFGVGYGTGLYGTESYGTARTQTINSIVVEPGAWSLDIWGEDLVAVANWEGQIYQWSPDSPTTVAALVTGDTGSGSAEAPEQNRALLVTNERHLMLIGAGDWSGVLWTPNPRKIWFSSSEDLTEWEATATNSAGDLELQTDGVAQCGVRWQNENIVWTTTDVHRVNYINPPNYYGRKSIGAKAGIISQTAFVATDNFVFWVGPEGFHTYTGTVTEIECEVWDYYIDRLNKTAKQEISVGHNPRFNEIWVFYPAGSSTLNDSYLIWNYKENHWSIGDIPRTAWHEALIFDNPIAAKPLGNTSRAETYYRAWNHDEAYDVTTQFEAPGESLQILPGSFQFLDDDGAAYGTEDTDYYVDYVSGQVTTLSGGSFADDEQITASFTVVEISTPRTALYFHEDGYNNEFPGNPVRDVWVEPAPIEIGQGDVLTEVTRVYQDTGREDDLDPVSNSLAVEIEFDTRLAPEAPKETHGPYQFDAARGYTDVRFNGRQVTPRIRQIKNELWRMGMNRLDIIPGSGR